MSKKQSATASMLTDKRRREEFVAASVSSQIAAQITALREQRKWSKAEFGRRANKPQSVIARLEDPEYGRLNVQTLIELAAVFDVALQIKFVSFAETLGQIHKIAPQLEVPSFGDDPALNPSEGSFVMIGFAKSVGDLSYPVRSGGTEVSGVAIQGMGDHPIVRSLPGDILVIEPGPSRRAVPEAETGSSLAGKAA